MSERERVEGTDGVHLSPPAFCLNPTNNSVDKPVSLDLLGRLAALLFPQRLYEYEGRSKGFARLLGYSPKSTRVWVKPSGDARLTLPVISAAEKIIARYQSELTAISAGLAMKRRELESREKPRPGFFAMRVKRARLNDQSGQKF